jgi:hypothetical protein
MAVCIGATKNAMPLPVRSCDLRGAALAAVAACVVAPGGAVGDVAHLFERAAGSDLSRVESDVEELAGLARAHLEAVGLGQAMVDFAAPPWRRHANGLHLWGVTRSGMSWFDAGHPDVVGLDVSGMTDIEGRNWWQLAIGSAEGNVRDGRMRVEIRTVNHRFFNPQLRLPLDRRSKYSTRRRDPRQSSSSVG